MEYVVRPADLVRDADAIVSVWARNLKSHDEAAHRRKFEWYYRQCPWGARCWLLEAPNGGPVVGTAGLGVRRFRLQNGTSARVGVASDFAVDTEHRSLRPAMMLARAVAASVGSEVDYIYGLPNSQSAGVFKRVGYDVSRKLQRYVKVLRSERFLRSRLRSAILRRPMAVLADAATRVGSRETWLGRRGTSMAEVQRFDARFDDLWSRAAGAGIGAGVERTAVFLEWRYFNCPLHRYVTLALTAPGGELLGYAVCLLQQDEQAALIDLFRDRSRVRTDDLLAGVVRWARQRGASSVSCDLEGCEDLEAAFLRFGFRHRGETTVRAVIGAEGGPPTSAGLRGCCFLRVDEDYN